MTKNPSLEWMPGGRTVSMRAAGKWWDAVRVPRGIGLDALDRLGDYTGAVIEDPSSARLYWLVPPGEADGWSLPVNAQVLVLGGTAYVAVPGPECTFGPRWRVPPTQGDALTDTVRLHAALAAAAAHAVGPRARSGALRVSGARTAERVDEAYKAWLDHLYACHGCSTGIAYCPGGEQLRHVWREARQP
ncbi:hypothetical protein ACFQ0X_29650 [Streptomyces rectiviolaceus]|uniref:Uncharacterized protein n=1 Tax=Streptomyces rectiviolaceus TaxID=332591 RepID=A0ABP6N685_9ACTN